ncbi:MAG: methyl-accepting chemotaxis protein [Desulfobacteraceae bacterium]|nr:methyl-accepting chemotaxis protein [Desulfobacteraceae bacterium]
MKFLNNLKVGLRMGIGFGLLVIIIFFIGASWYMAASSNKKNINEIAEVRLPSLVSIFDMEYEIEKVVTAQRTLLNPENDIETRNAQYNAISEARNKYSSAMEDYLKLPQTPAEKKEWDQFTQHLEEWAEVNNRFFALSKDLDKTGILNPKELMSRIQMFRGDHYDLMNKALMLIFEGREFSGGEDYQTCYFGFWLSDFTTTNQVLIDLINEIKPSHVKFHGAIGKIKEAVKNQDRDGALKIFNEEMSGSAKHVFEGFDSIIDEIFNAFIIQEEMSKLALFEVLEKQEKTLSHLDEVSRINLELANNQKKIANVKADSNMRFSLISLCTGFILAIVFGFIVTRSILAPLRQSGRLFKAISEGDMTQNVPKDLLEQKDELGEMGRQIDEMTKALRKVFSDLGQGVKTLASSSTELSAISDQTAQGARSSSKSAETVAAAAEELTASAGSMVDRMEESAGNLNSVASAMEQMTSTISEIASNTSTANQRTEDSVNQIESFARVMKELGAAADEIGKVTETISNISEQTNLLALNATIEAARAGDAGKGFAVVAGEIKELASQTANATKDISQRISGIQNASQRAEVDVESIVKNIGKVDDIVSAIASAIEEQTSAISEVSSNINLASDMVNEASNQSSEMKNVSEEISRDMASVSSSAVQVEGASAQVQQTVRELSNLSEEIQEMIMKFKV